MIAKTRQHMTFKLGGELLALAAAFAS